MPWDDTSALRIILREMEQELESMVGAAATGSSLDWAAYQKLVGRIEATRQWAERIREIRSDDGRQNNAP